MWMCLRKSWHAQPTNALGSRRLNQVHDRLSNVWMCERWNQRRSLRHSLRKLRSSASVLVWTPAICSPKSDSSRANGRSLHAWPSNSDSTKQALYSAMCFFFGCLVVGYFYFRHVILILPTFHDIDIKPGRRVSSVKSSDFVFVFECFWERKSQKIFRWRGAEILKIREFWTIWRVNP